ncbi:hypothetical protein EAE99_001810 [Botrytis elliptica]|nr:hypothetical protein EAE99_001810 [Botrytis elliptica]
MRGSRSSDFEQKDAVVEIIETQNKTVLNLHEFYRFSKAWEVRSCARCIKGATTNSIRSLNTIGRFNPMIVPPIKNMKWAIEWS